MSRLAIRTPVRCADSMEDRLTDLEVRHEHQADGIERLDAAVTRLQKELLHAERRIERLEQTVEDLVKMVAVPANERPPHY